MKVGTRIWGPDKACPLPIPLASHESHGDPHFSARWSPRAPGGSCARDGRLQRRPKATLLSGSRAHHRTAPADARRRAQPLPASPCVRVRLLRDREALAAGPAAAIDERRFVGFFLRDELDQPIRDRDERLAPPGSRAPPAQPASRCRPTRARSDRSAPARGAARARSRRRLALRLCRRARASAPRGR